MFVLKPELRDGEVVQGEFGTSVYQVRGSWSSRGSNVRLWLTNQRIILKAALGPQRTLPLYAITGVREEKIGWIPMVRIEFAGGHREWFSVQDRPEFLLKLQGARAQAPHIPDGISPGKTASGMAVVFGIGLFVFGVLAAVTLLAAFLFVVVFGVLWSLSLSR